MAARNITRTGIRTLGDALLQRTALALTLTLGLVSLQGCAQQPSQAETDASTVEGVAQATAIAIPPLAPLTAMTPAPPPAPEPPPVSSFSPGIEINSAELGQFAQNQDAVLDSLITLASLPGAPENGADAEWRLVVEAAMVFADQRCEKFIEARYQKPDATFQLAPSSIRSVIQERKRRFRQGLTSEAFQSRPAAMTTIQSYMALCTPATAEGAIQAAITEPATGAMAVAAPPRSARRGSGAGRAPPPGPRDESGGIGSEESFIVDYGLGITSAISDAERSLTLEDGQRIQAALCVAADGNFGRQGSRTRQAIAELQGVLGFEQTGLLTKDQASALLSMSSCPQGFLTYYERITFTSPQAIQQLQKQLNLQLADVGVSIQLSGILDDSTREAVRLVKRRAGVRVTPIITAEFAADVLNRPSRQRSTGALPSPPPQ